MLVERQCLHVCSSITPIPLHPVSQPGKHSPTALLPQEGISEQRACPIPFLAALRASFGPAGTAFPRCCKPIPYPSTAGAGELQRVKAGQGAAAVLWAEEVRVLHKVAIVLHTVPVGFCLSGSHLRPTAWHQDSTGGAGAGTHSCSPAGRAGTRCCCC